MELQQNQRSSVFLSLCLVRPAGDPSALVVLVEEELVVIDLQTEGWPVIQTPYLVPLHCSAITCSHHVSAIPLKLWERILAAGDLQQTHYSKKVSPVSTSDERHSYTLDLAGRGAKCGSRGW